MLLPTASLQLGCQPFVLAVWSIQDGGLWGTSLVSSLFPASGFSRRWGVFMSAGKKLSGLGTVSSLCHTAHPLHCEAAHLFLLRFKLGWQRCRRPVRVTLWFHLASCLPSGSRATFLAWSCSEATSAAPHLALPEHVFHLGKRWEHGRCPSERGIFLLEAVTSVKWFTLNISVPPSYRLRFTCKAL